MFTTKYDFNPRPPRGGRPKLRPVIEYKLCISIHAPREGGDVRCMFHAHLFHISIHAPREGGDQDCVRYRKAGLYFNPRPPRGGRRGDFFIMAQHVEISIHAPREGGDVHSLPFCTVPINFNPRPPRGGRHSITLSPRRQRIFQSTPPARGATTKMN